MMNRAINRALLVAAGLAFSAVAGTTTALAQQQDSLWGGGTTQGGSGREVIRFSPAHPAGQIIVSFSDRRLYLITKTGEALSYPIAIPREQSRWQGVTSVTQKRINPSWTPTPTMIAENPRLPRWVPGGHPMNPLGVRGLYLGSSTYRIHGTDAPWTIGSAVSKGCIRMYNQDVVDLFPRVPVGAKVTVTWATFRGGVAQAGLPPSSGPAPREARASGRRMASITPVQASAATAYAPSAAPAGTETYSEPGEQRPRYAVAKRVVAKKKVADVAAE